MKNKHLTLNINGIKRKVSKLTHNLAVFAEDFSIIPTDDPRQALRHRRFFISLGIYIINFPLSYFAYLAGLMSVTVLFWNWMIIASINVFLYVFFRSGLNKRMKDPSLTSLQICLASLVVMHLIFFVYEARTVLFSLYILILLFGIFRLDTRQFLYVSSFILVTYGIDVFLLHTFRPQDIDLRIEIIQWFALVVVLMSVSFIGGNISSLRRELSESRKELRDSLIKIQEMALHDDLTGFYNRRHLMELMETEHNRSNRTGSVFSVAMLDLDKFKNVNDTFGHQVGDEILMTFSNIVRTVLRKTDFCGRLGGEEFLIVLAQAGLNDAQIFAERLRACVEESLFVDMGQGRKSKVTVSIGLAEHKKSEDIERMISRADESMYKAKKNGRNRVEVSE